MFAKKVIILLFLIFSIKIISTKMQKMILLDRYEACNLPSNSPVTVKEITARVLHHQTLLNATFYLKRNISRLMVHARIDRCSNKEQLDSCAYFTALRLKNACPLMNQKNTLLSPTLQAYNPPLTCPLRQGKYELVDGSYDPNLVQFFPLDSWYWKINMICFDADNEEYLVKICLEGRVLSYYS